jgi:hypothetical protein
MIRRLSAAAFLCVLLSACGGGGGGSSLPQTQPNSPSSAAKQKVKVSIAIPAAKTLAAAARRNPKYISVNTNSGTIAVNATAPVVVNLSATSPNCIAAADGTRLCTVLVDAPVGSDTFTVELYASTDGSGTPLSQNETTQVIAAGVANTVTMTLAGLVTSISLTLANATPLIGTPTTIPLTVNFLDASGAMIIGNYPFADAITLTNSDTTGGTQILTGVGGTPITELDNPTQAAGLIVAYNGVGNAPVTFGATAAYTPATSVTPAVLTPSTTAATPPPAAAAFVDWPMYGYDQEHSGFNPSSTTITPASISSLHLGWQIQTNGGQTQPVVASNIAGHKALLIIANYVAVEAHDALTGGLVWSSTLPKQDVQACGTSGVSGTVVYDKALGAIFAVAGTGNPAPNHIVLYKLDVGTGVQTGSVDVTPTLQLGEANDSHAAVAMANGQIYVGTGSDCEGSAGIAYPSWRGRVVSVNPSTMALNNTFFMTWGQGTPVANYGGGGVWGWGGVTADASGNIYAAGGNAETNMTVGTGTTITAPFTATDNEQAGFAEHIVKISPDLTTVLGSNYPGFNFAIGYDDLDFTGSPVVFQPNGCPNPLTATQGKGGTLVIHNTTDMSVAQTYMLSVPAAKAFYMGNPAFSPVTGYVYAAITAQGAGSSMLAPGLAAIGSCGTTMPWHAVFGPDSTTYAKGSNPRSAPTVTAGGVVFIGTVCTPTAAGGCGAPGTANGAIWAIDGSTSPPAGGTVLGGGNPILHTGSPIRVPPTVDGQWVYVYDTSGNLYGLTIDPTVPAITPKATRRLQPQFLYKGES